MVREHMILVYGYNKGILTLMTVKLESCLGSPVGHIELLEERVHFNCNHQSPCECAFRISAWEDREERKQPEETASV